MRLIDDQQGACPACDLPNCLVIARLRQHDPDVGQCRFEQDRRDIAIGEGRIEACDVVELGDAGRLRDIDLRPDVAADRHDRAVGAEHRDRLVDRAVVAMVVDDDLGPPRDVASEPERPAVRVGRREGELP